MSIYARESTREELLSYLDKLQDRLSQAERDLKFLSRQQADAQLRADNERLREALRKIAQYEEGPEVTGSFDNPGDAKTARAALEEDGG